MINLVEKYRRASLEKKVSIILLGIVAIYVIFLIISGQVHGKQLKERGVYFVAQISRIESSKNGDHFYITYTFKEKGFRGSFKPDFNFKPTKVGAYIFIKL